MSNTTIRAYAAMQPGEALVPYQFDAGELLPHQVEVQVEYCGLCHSDLSVINNDWRSSVYPVVAGHEIIGTIVQLGSEAKGLSVGQRVGIGWTAKAASTAIHACPAGRCNVPAAVSPPLSAMPAVLPIRSAPAGNGSFPYRMIWMRKVPARCSVAVLPYLIRSLSTRFRRCIMSG